TVESNGGIDSLLRNPWRGISSRKLLLLDAVEAIQAAANLSRAGNEAVRATEIFGSALGSHIEPRVSLLRRCSDLPSQLQRLHQLGKYLVDAEWLAKSVGDILGVEFRVD